MECPVLRFHLITVAELDHEGLVVKERCSLEFFSSVQAEAIAAVDRA